ncbi:MAG: SDR family NAD(P)-dependent oxidoreductase [bacterium]|nr:SDR family NAD(P)-dependent oxidoreductase [bacterium]
MSDTSDRKQDVRTAVVLGASADIGIALTQRLLDDDYRVVGFARDIRRLAALKSAERFSAIACDLADPSSVAAALNSYEQLDLSWQLFVSAAGTMEPIGRFTDLDFDAWERSVTVNSTAQLRVLHGLWPKRAVGEVDVMLMAGGGTNNPFRNYSAYCVAKIALIKMCELLDDEEPELNIFIVGPGFVPTRIHEETLRAGARADEGYQKAVDFLKTEGTSHDDIYANLKWCMEKGRSVAGGRNFSTVHDPWREGGAELGEKLKADGNAYRLRRAQP